jgi:hypothetical protein
MPLMPQSLVQPIVQQGSRTFPALAWLLWLPWLALADAISAAFYSHIVGLLISRGDTRQCIEKVTCRGGLAPSPVCEKRRGKPRRYFGVVISRTTSCMRAR